MNSSYDEEEPQEDPYCVGCHRLIEEGSVVQFGEGIWHFECFRCAKCHAQVECDSNLLLLFDGSPVCENCSYNCHVCHQTIRDEAIMTGEEAYHADCFRCVQCGNKIEDLVFTQTSKGIFCTACHEIRKQLKLKRKEDKSRKTTSAEYAMNKQLPQIPNPPSHSSNRPVPITQLLDSQLINDYLQSPSPDRRDYNGRRGESMDVPNRSDLNVVREGGRNRSESVDQLSQRPKLGFLDRPEDLAASRQASASSILNSYSDASKGVTTSKIRSRMSLESQRLSELNTLLDNPNGNDESPPSSSPPTSFYHSLEDDTLEQLTLDGTKHDEAYVENLKKQLRATLTRLREVETNFSKIKSVSRNALNEFNLAKEEFAYEVSARQSAEESSRKAMAQLKALQDADANGKTEYVRVSREEISNLGLTRNELDITCKQLRTVRESLSREISELSEKYQTGLSSYISPSVHLEHHQQALQQEIKSLQLEREMVKNDIEKHTKLRDEVIHETVMLNLKMAELTDLNNDLSRRVTEREREAAAVMAGTAFLNPTLSPPSKHNPHHQHQDSLTSNRSSNELATNQTTVKKVAQRDSFNGTQAPRKFNFRKNKGGNRFGKLGNTTAGSHPKGRSPPLMNGEPSSYGSDNNTLMGPPMPTPSISESSGIRRDKRTMGSPPPNSESSVQLFTQYQGQHELVQASFLRPVKCEICGDKIWGRNELKCQACGSIIHQKCLPHLPNKCNRKLFSEQQGSDASDKAQSMFGNELANQVRSDGGSLPLLVKQCVEAVEKRGLDFEGIYRKSGGASQMRFIQQAFDQGDAIDLTDDDQFNDICAITSVLKTYFRELPNPLLTYELHNKFIDAITNKARDDQIQTFYQLVQQLPAENYNTLKYLMLHLDKVRQNSADNLMTNAVIEFILNHMYVLFNRSSLEEEPPKTSSPAVSTASVEGHRRAASSDDRRRAIVPPAIPPRAGGDYI
ncbi:hypothetical protein K450DRAFT_247604 [Umbelopsis ramanniana AG]|uniref:RhoGAP-domain-containing protein n=1 Tax=Umbelopsis ramanniana AG TaxID=1314678 RepID=A0AAD5E773_UMBRA|nr:uncharacterized protein K450DRAFT_247604 [Umbelopsis ramanniana AG]KAI8578378.1 hypothetical protein K450DRAFT_247604 [Umbelopsis ramanniana AG]